MKRALWIASAAVAWAACAGDARADWPRVNAKFASGKVAIRKVVILPAQVAFNKLGVKGSEGGTPEAAPIGASLYAAVASELAVRGVEVLPSPLAQARDDAARYAVADLQSKYDNVAVQMRRTPRSVDRGRFTLGDRVAQFEPGAAADALVFIRAAGVALTPGRKAIAVATWGGWFSLLSQFRAEVTFVDAKTGDVLALIRFSRARDMSKDPDRRFQESLRKAMRDVPFPLPPPKS